MKDLEDLLGNVRADEEDHRQEIDSYLIASGWVYVYNPRIPAWLWCLEKGGFTYVMDKTTAVSTQISIELGHDDWVPLQIRRRVY